MSLQCTVFTGAVLFVEFTCNPRLSQTMGGNKLLSCSSDRHVCFWNTSGQVPVNVGEFHLFQGTSQLLSRLLVLKRQHRFMTFTTQEATTSSSRSQLSPMLWRYSNPPEQLTGMDICTESVCCASIIHLPGGPGSLVALGMKNGVVKVYSAPQCVLAAKLIFAEMDGCDCIEISATLASAVWNLSMVQLTDVLVATLWSNGVVKVCKALARD